MNDYMTALLERFGSMTNETLETKEQVRMAEAALKEQLTKEQRKLLLRLTDSHNALREAAVLAGFISGYRLAAGIHRELDALPRFSLMTEEEERARKQYDEERRGNDVETQTER